MFLLWIIAQGILGLVESQWDQVTVRNWAFCTFAGTLPKKQRTTLRSRFRYYIGKTVAGYYFLAAVAVAFICPFVFVSSVIINEFETWSWPVSESDDAVGQVSCQDTQILPDINVLQWSNWVSACFVIIAAIIQKYHHAWLMSIKLGCATVVHVFKWTRGKETFRKEPKEFRTKENSAIEDAKEFFTQCAKPFTHSWRSISSTRGQLRNGWREFKEWHNDPVEISSREFARLSTDESYDIEVRLVFSSKDVSLLEFLYERAIPDQVPLSTFAKLPSHMTLSPMGSYWPKPSPTPRSRSQSSMVKSSHHTPSEPSQSNTAIYRAKSDTGDAHIDPRSLRPFPRSAYSSTESTPSQETLYPPTARRHNTEATMPPQAAWAPTFRQPRKVQPLRKSEMSSRPPMPGYADS